MRRCRDSTEVRIDEAVAVLGLPFLLGFLLLRRRRVLHPRRAVADAYLSQNLVCLLLGKGRLGIVAQPTEGVHGADVGKRRARTLGTRLREPRLQDDNDLVNRGLANQAFRLGAGSDCWGIHQEVLEPATDALHQVGLDAHTKCRLTLAPHRNQPLPDGRALASSTETDNVVPER